MLLFRRVRALAGKEPDWPREVEGRSWWVAVVEGVSPGPLHPRHSYRRLRPLLQHRPENERIKIRMLEEALVFPATGIDGDIHLGVLLVAYLGEFIWF